VKILRQAEVASRRIATVVIVDARAGLTPLDSNLGELVAPYGQALLIMRRQSRMRVESGTQDGAVFPNSSASMFFEVATVAMRTDMMRLLDFRAVTSDSLWQLCGHSDFSRT